MRARARERVCVCVCVGCFCCCCFGGEGEREGGLAFLRERHANVSKLASQICSLPAET